MSKKIARNDLRHHGKVSRSNTGNAGYSVSQCPVYLESLLEHTDGFVLVCDEKGIPRLFNSAYAGIIKSVFGIEMRPGMQPHKLLEDPEAVSYWESLHHRALAGEQFKTRYTYCFPDRSVRDYEISVRPISGKEEILGFSAVANDITIQQNARKALSESEVRFKMLFESAPIAMVIADAENWLIADVNQESCRIGKCRKEDLIGKHTSELVFFRGKTQALFLREIQEKGSVSGMEVEIPGENGGARIIHIFARLISIAGRSHAISSFIDVTDSRKLEINTQQAQKMDAIGTLTAGIAHDYNNMLTVILGNIALAKQITPPESEISGFLDQAEKASLKIKHLTEELMSVSESEELELKPGNLQVLLSDASAAAARENVFQVKKNIPNNLWPVLHDPRRLRYVLRNILSNAAESMPMGGEITLEAKNVMITSLQTKKEFPLDEGSYVKISISDHGIGIPRESLSRIFDPYYSTKKRGERKGQGLGMATSYNVIKKHGGYISIESETGKGTTVTVYLPALVDTMR